MQSGEAVVRGFDETVYRFKTLVRQFFLQNATLYFAGRGHRELLDGERAQILGRLVRAQVRRPEKERALQAALRARFINVFPARLSDASRSGGFPRNDRPYLFTVSLIRHGDRMDLRRVLRDLFQRVLDGDR